MKRNILKMLAAFVAIALFISTQTYADTVTYIITDPAGSPIAGMNESGTVIWREHYQPFGEKKENSSSSSDNDIWFAGKEHDDETGLSFFGARNYDPTIGRFVSIDPQGFDEGNIQSFGRYAYGNNNPYKFVDPNGESPVDLVFFAADAVKLAGAIYSGVGIGTAAVDFAISGASVFSPIPGVGQVVKASRIGAKVAKSVAKEPNRIYSARELKRRADNPRTNNAANPNHNFPESFNAEIFKGNKTIVTDKYHLYTKPGTLNGRSGTYEIGVKPSASGRTEVITHRFFNPSKK